MPQPTLEYGVRFALPALLFACAASSALPVQTPLAAAAAAGGGGGGEMTMAQAPLTMSEVLAASQPADWRSPDAEHVLYLELASGRVVFELAPAFAPEHVTNVKALAREGYFDGLSIVRVQDNYVVQWGDPESKKPITRARRTLPPEFERAAAGLELTLLPDPDTYAPEVGFAQGFPAARDPASGKAWLVHCYGMLGAGRDNSADSGGGAELYVVIGHAPRQLDRNVTLLGRVLSGMALLTVLPRGSVALGFYEKVEQRVAIAALRVAADVPAAQRTELEVLRTDTPTFQALVESRRNRREPWFQRAAGRIEVCNVPFVVRHRAP